MEHGLSYKPVLDIQRFQQLLDQEDHSNSTHSTTAAEKAEIVKRKVGVEESLSAQKQACLDKMESPHREGRDARMTTICQGTSEGEHLRSGGGAGRDVCNGGSVTAVSKLTGYPTLLASWGRGDITSTTSEAASVPSSLRATTTSQQRCSTMADNLLLVSRKAPPVQQGSLLQPRSGAVRVSTGPPGCHGDITPHSKRTNKIHTDLNKLEKVRKHFLDIGPDRQPVIFCCWGVFIYKTKGEKLL